MSLRKNLVRSFLFVSLSALSATSWSSAKVTIATSGDYAPANMSNEQCAAAVGVVIETNNQQKVCGFEVDLLSKVCEVRQLDCQWTLRPFAWNEQNPNFPGILDHLFSADREYDLVVAYLRGNTERLEKLSGSASYIEGYPVMYKSSQLLAKVVQKNKKGFPFSKNKGKKIKIAASGVYATELVSPEFAYYSAQELTTLEVVSVDSLEDQITLLNSGEVDFVYGPNISASQFIAKGHVSFLDVPQLENSVEAGSRVFAAKNKKGKLLVDQINQGLLELWKTGEYQKIFDKYYIYDSWGKQNGPKE